MSELQHILDYNGLYALDLDYFADSRHVDISLEAKDQPWNRFRRSVIGQLHAFAPDGTEIGRSELSPGNKLRFTDLPAEFELRMGDETIGRYRREGDQLVQTARRPLSVFETRRVGTFHGEFARPYHQPNDPELIETARTAITTDYHTHSSGQISAQGLVKIGIDHELGYPIHLLVEAGILTRQQCETEDRFNGWKWEERIQFPPLEPQTFPAYEYAVRPAKSGKLDKYGKPLLDVATVPLSALTDAERTALEQKMCLAANRQSTHTEMEYDAYRYRYPIAKKPEVLEDNLRQIAREYAEQGINYAEIAYVGLDNPKLLATLHTLVPKIEAETGVRLRFMVGIPRNWAIEEIQNTLNKTKILAQSPYITGVDFLGYEVNKTDRFSEALEQLVAWADEHAHGFTIRAHAGENDKNPENIKQLLQLTSKYKNIRTRIGHGLYGLDEETLSLAKSMDTDPENPRLVMEFNPDSNMALNNIDGVSQVPFDMALKNNLPFVVGSDCSGVYQTTAQQLGLATLYAGLGQRGFETLKQHQTNITNAQIRTAEERIANIPDWHSQQGKDAFVAKLEGELKIVEMIAQKKTSQHNHIAARKLLIDQGKLLESTEHESIEHDPPKHIDKVLGDRRPIAIVGASGSNWDRISPEQREKTKVSLDMLVHVLDPEKAYLVQGRTKNSGLSKLVAEAANARNTESGDGKNLLTVAMVAQPEYDRQESFDNLSHLIEIKGELMDVPDAIVDHAVSRSGVVVAAGGAAFTRNIITKADYKMKAEDEGALMLLDGPEGASTEKAKRLNPHYRVPDGREIITRLFNLYGRDLFVDGFNPLAPGVLDKLEAESHDRVKQYHVETPDPTGQRITDSVTIDPPQQERLL